MKLVTGLQSAFGTFVQRLRQDRRGVAAIEFAMIVPIMVMLFIGSIEFSQALTVDRRVTQAASSCADLIARAPSTGMSPAEVDGALQIIVQLIPPYDIAPLTVNIISVRAVAGGGGALTYTVDWSRNNQGTTPYARGATYTNVPAGLLAAGETVVIGEANYTYSPLIFKYFITSAFTMSERFYLKPRNASCVILTGVMTTCA